MVRTASCAAACCLLLTLMLVLPASGYPSDGYYRVMRRQYDPEEIVGMIHRLNNLLEMEQKMETDNRDGIISNKRGLDLGLSRGYSGALQAKHLMGIAAATYAGGPGRRRRDTSQ